MLRAGTSLEQGQQVAAEQVAAAAGGGGSRWRDGSAASLLVAGSGWPELGMHGSTALRGASPTKVAVRPHPCGVAGGLAEEE